MRMLRKIGRPASCRIESCRVNVVQHLRFDAPDGEAAPFFLPALSVFFLRSFLTEILVTK